VMRRAASLRVKKTSHSILQCSIVFKGASDLYVCVYMCVCVCVSECDSPTSQQTQPCEFCAVWLARFIGFFAHSHGAECSHAKAHARAFAYIKKGNKVRGRVKLVGNLWSFLANRRLKRRCDHFFAGKSLAEFAIFPVVWLGQLGQFGRIDTMRGDCA
jgi:hypothetical protein